MKCIIPEEWKEWELSSNCLWFLEASVIHLATFWHTESLMHILDVCPYLKNFATNTHKFTPLHVAASCFDESVSTSVLIKKKAHVNALNSHKQTPLHIAAEYGFTNTVISLLFEGKANVMVLDQKNNTPLHLAKTSKILNILLTKTNA